MTDEREAGWIDAEVGWDGREVVWGARVLSSNGRAVG